MKQVMLYYYLDVKAGQWRGPLPFSEIKKMYQEQKLGADTILYEKATGKKATILQFLESHVPGGSPPSELTTHVEEQTTHAPGDRFCHYCGKRVLPSAVYCPGCGSPTAGRDIENVKGGRLPGQKNRIVYIVLAFFVGNLGIHNFYAGRTEYALIQLCAWIAGILLFFLVIGIPILLGLTIWALIEAATVEYDGNGNRMYGF